MSERVPAVDLAAFSSPRATATSGEQGRAELARADVYTINPPIRNTSINRHTRIHDRHRAAHHVQDQHATPHSPPIHRPTARST